MSDAKEKTLIHVQLEALEIAVTNVAQTAQLLEERLEPVLKVKTTDRVAPEDEDKMTVPLANTIRALTLRLEDLVHDYNDIINRLAV